MSISRREILKLAAFVPLISISTFPGYSLLAPEGPKKARSNKGGSSSVNILLHGLFFLEFQDNDLIVAAPFYVKHRYFYRDHQNPTSLVCVSPAIDDFTDAPGSPLP